MTEASDGSQRPARRHVLAAGGAGLAAIALGTERAGAHAVASPPIQEAELRSTLHGSVLFPGDPGFEDECKVYNPVVRHKPHAIVVPTCSADVAAAVGYAAFVGRPVAVQATGHGIGVPADGAVLINTRRLDSVTVDPRERTARIGGGVRWQAVVEAAGKHGLAPLCGSSLTVGAVGFTLGGGIGPLGRSYGFAADRVQELSLVTADAQIRRVTPRRHRDLFWGVRGGKSNFGAVTEMEIQLVPVSRLYGGVLLFAGQRAGEVLDAYSSWTKRLPGSMTTSLAFLRPPGGRMFVRVTVAYLGKAAEGDRLLDPLRELGPDTDTVKSLPFTEVGTIYNDPPATPVPVFERSGLLRVLDHPAITKLVELAGPGAQLPPGMVELRHLGGALERRPAVGNAVGHRDARYLLFLAMPAPADQGDSVTRLQSGLMQAMRPHLTGGVLPNFMSSTDTTDDRVQAAYEPADLERLLALKREYDPHNLFRINHNLRAGTRRGSAH